MTPEEIKKHYNLYYTDITNQSMVDGEDEYPVLPCELEVIPDYLCLYGNPQDYNKTSKTCLCFYQYDDKFDGITGLYNAIYYNDVPLLSFYRERFKNVTMVIEPDYSQVRDIERIENKYRQFKARVVGLWFLTEMKIPVIPNLNYADLGSFDYMLDGIKDSKLIAVSLKGIMDKTVEEDLLIQAIRQAVDHTKVKNFVVFSTGYIDEKVEEYFKYATSKGILYYIPDNAMRLQNIKNNGKD